MKSCIRWLVLAVGLIALSAYPDRALAQDQRTEPRAHSVDAIAEAIDSRRQSVEAFRIEGSIEEIHFSDGGAPSKVLNRQFELFMKGESEKAHIWGEFPHEGPDVPKGATIQWERERAYYDGEFRSVAPNAAPLPEGSRGRDGIVHTEEEFRPLQMALGGELGGGADLELRGVRTSPAGSEIVVVGAADASARVEYEYLLDSDRDYLPVGYLRYDSQGLLGQEITILYEEDDEIGFVPSSVTMIHFDAISGVTHWVKEITLDRVEVNKRIDDREFIIDFPEGMKVADSILGFQYIVGEPTPTPLPPPEARPAAPASPPPAIQIEAAAGEAHRQSSASNFIRIGFGLTLFITGIAIIALYQSMRK